MPIMPFPKKDGLECTIAEANVYTQ